MAKSLNKVQLLGHLGADPEVRSIANGDKVANVSLATSYRYKAGDEWKEKTEWHKLVAWKQTAEVLEKYAKKGSRIYVEGSIQYRTWLDREGQTRYTTEINVREVILLDGRPQGAPATAGATTKAQPKNGFSEEFPEALDAEDDDLPFDGGR